MPASATRYSSGTIKSDGVPVSPSTDPLAVMPRVHATPSASPCDSPDVTLRPTVETSIGAKATLVVERLHQGNAALRRGGSLRLGLSGSIPAGVTCDFPVVDGDLNVIPLGEAGFATIQWKLSLVITAETDINIDTNAGFECGMLYDSAIGNNPGSDSCW